MLTLRIEPHVGIGPVKLGMSRDHLRNTMSSRSVPLASSRGDSDYYFKASIQIEFGNDGTASFIGVNSHRDISLEYGGVDLFDLDARSAFDLIATQDNSGEHSYNQNGYIFPSQMLTLYNANLQYDHKRERSRSIWGQIGIADRRYLNSILQIRKGRLNA